MLGTLGKTGTPPTLAIEDKLAEEIIVFEASEDANGVNVEMNDGTVTVAWGWLIEDALPLSALNRSTGLVAPLAARSDAVLEEDNGSSEETTEDACACIAVEVALCTAN
jgi:hypothetical protein